MASLDYLAGFFDGEGCVSIIRSMPWQHVERGWPPTYVLRVSVAGTRREIHDEFQLRFGGGVYSHPPRSLKHSQQWDWVVMCGKARDFLTAIRPLLIIKRYDADVGNLCRVARRSHNDAFSKIL